MSPKKQQIAIAESLGYTPTPYGRWTLDPAGLCGPYFDAPNYTADRNAIHAVLESQLDRLDESLGDFYAHLERACYRERGLSPAAATGNAITGFSGWIAHASAAALCEAYLRTLGLWTE